MEPTPQLESAGVHFPVGFARRLEQLVARLGAERERGAARLGARADALGDEFAGFRPYRAGEDVRHLDWGLLARLDQPFVRVHTRPAGERWRILLDASGSMGLGRPGKLAFAAQLAVALAAVAQRAGARAELRVIQAGGEGLRLEFARRGDLARWMGALEGLRAQPGARAAAPEQAARDVGGGRLARLFLLGDLQDLEPERALGLGRPGRRVHLAQLLAPHERELPDLAAVRLVDREDGAALELQPDRAARARYAAALARQQAGWRRLSGRAGFAFSTWSSAEPFERAARALVGA